MDKDPGLRHPARRFLRAALTAGAACLITVTAAGTASAAVPPDELQRITDQYLFTVSLDEFSAIRADTPNADQLDWSSDACSWSPDEPAGYSFTSSCHRHDFGYRNYKSQSRFTEATRLTIDDNFRDDMYSVCGDNGTCRGVATIYYNAVRQFGASSESTAEALEKAEAPEKAEQYVARHG